MLRLLSFFPSVNFGLLSAEIFPWASIYSLFIIRTANFRFVIILLVLLNSAVFVAVDTNFNFLGEHIRSLAAYLNPILVFFSLLSARYDEILRLEALLKYLLIGLIALGLFQFFGVLGQLDFLFKFMVPRASGDMLAELGRGVTLLSSEPSRAGYELLFIYSAWRVVSHNEKYLIYDLLFICFQLIIIQSALSALITFVYFLLIYRQRIPILVLFAVPFVALLVAYVDTRATGVVRAVIDASSFSGMFDYLIDTSGFRLVSVISAYWYGLTHIFGGGVGLWQLTSIAAMESTGFVAGEINFFVYAGGGSFISIRPTSYAANLALDVGAVGLLIFFGALFKYFKTLYSFGSVNAKCFTSLFIFSFFVIGAVGNPVPWMLLALIIRRLRSDLDVRLSHRGDDVALYGNRRDNPLVGAHNIHCKPPLKLGH